VANDLKTVHCSRIGELGVPLALHSREDSSFYICRSLATLIFPSYKGSSATKLLDKAKIQKRKNRK
jgi:hypothetical protein